MLIKKNLNMVFNTVICKGKETNESSNDPSDLLTSRSEIRLEDW